MSANAFRDEELVTRRVKINGEWRERVFPVVGGRLRLAHETNERLSIETEILKLETDLVVTKATVETDKGRYCGTGTASAQRDARLADSLVELAETRAIARALRFGGFGVEYCSAEEVSHLADSEPAPAKTKEPGSNRKPAQRSAGNGKATTAQVRALYALTRRAGYTDEDIAQMLSGLEAATFEALSREAASRLIGSLQTEVAA